MSFNENSLEQAVIALLQQQGYTYVNGKTIHKQQREVLLRDDLQQYLLNKYSADDITINEVKRIIHDLETEPASVLYESNRNIIRKIADGYTFKRDDHTQKDLFIELIDFAQGSTNNIFKIVNQLEIQGFEKRIPDLIVYINGLPLVVIEFKSAVKENCTIHDAYKQLTIRYRRDIPELMKYNALCVISDGVNSKSGSLFAPYDFFYSWRKVDGTEELGKDGIDSLHTMLQGLFNTSRLTDVIQNFIYFPDTPKSDDKIVCRYPQYYAARKLYENIKNNIRPIGSGKGGTYFGATGCGKSFTMLFLTRLLMKSSFFDSPTIVLITDRTDLDDQLSDEFTNAKKFIGDSHIISVESRDHLRTELSGRNSGGVFLTTIHKFTEDTQLLTDRANVICISDEAHRSQINLDQKLVTTKKGLERKYGFAKYLHDSLPMATYVGFTGTPVDGTLDVFGKVIDSYTMKESVDDNITVKILYEGRAAKVLLNSDKLKEIEDYYDRCVEEGSSEYQVEESKKAVTKMEIILGDPDRLKLVAEDFVKHYEKRIEEGATVRGKVMFVAASRPIAWALYKELIALRPHWADIREADEGVELTDSDKKKLQPIEKIKMVMTRHKDDEKELYDLLGTIEYRKKLDKQFKNEKSNFKIAVVVDMWLTGFDIPSLDTMYIDKPIKKHSLIQTISRVNRVYEGKDEGLIVDYIGIKKSMKLALKMYSKADADNFEEIGQAIAIVKDQLEVLGKLFHKFNMTPFFSGTPIEQLNCLNKAAEFVQLTDEIEKRFMHIVKRMRSAYNLCCGSEEVTEQERDYIHFYIAVRAIVHKLTRGDAPDTAQMNDTVRKMIEEALQSEGVEEIFKLDKDDSKPNEDIFSDEYLAKIDKIELPNTRIKLLQKLLESAVRDYKRVNRIKGVDFSQRLKKLVDLYNERDESFTLANDVLNDLADQFADLFEQLRKDRESFKDMGINYEEKAFYDILKAIAEKHKFEYPHEKLIELSKAVKAVVDDKSKYTDWANRDDIKAELKVDLILTLAEHGYPPVPKDEVFKEIFEQAENFRKYSSD